MSKKNWTGKRGWSQINVKTVFAWYIHPQSNADAVSLNGWWPKKDRKGFLSLRWDESVYACEIKKEHWMYSICHKTHYNKKNFYSQCIFYSVPTKPNTFAFNSRADTSSAFCQFHPHLSLMERLFFRRPLLYLFVFSGGVEECVWPEWPMRCFCLSTYQHPREWRKLANKLWTSWSGG